MTNKGMNKFTSRRSWFGAAMQVGGGATPQTVNDVTVLNFALRLANLESAFYQRGLVMFTAADFQNSVTVQMIGGTKIGANLYSCISAIALDELNHASTLVQAVYSLDGTPQAPDCYNLGFTTVDSFLQMAQTIENIGVMAYNGVIITQFETSNSTINNPDLQALVATIATVEGRHAAYFSLLNLTIPFPAPFDSTQTTAQIMSAINPFLTANCSGPPVPLTLAVAGAAKDSIITTNRTTVQLNASLSTSATGTPLTYLWQQDLGSPSAEIINDTSVMATAILMGGSGQYVIALKVTDRLGGSDQDTLRINYQP
jgi:bacterioferritin (cytochrome b1)